jgi:hypothetical protein
MRQIPSWVHEELLNWSRWCWEGAYPHPFPPDHCASIEHNYRRTAAEDYSDEAPPSKPIPANRENAIRVQAIFLRLPDSERVVLRAEYPQHRINGEMTRHELARKLGMDAKRYYHWLHLARLKVMVEF